MWVHLLLEWDYFQKRSHIILLRNQLQPSRILRVKQHLKLFHNSCFRYFILWSYSLTLINEIIYTLPVIMSTHLTFTKMSSHITELTIFHYNGWILLKVYYKCSLKAFEIIEEYENFCSCGHTGNAKSITRNLILWPFITTFLYAEITFTWCFPWNTKALWLDENQYFHNL